MLSTMSGTDPGFCKGGGGVWKLLNFMNIFEAMGAFLEN